MNYVIENIPVKYHPVMDELWQCSSDEDLMRYLKMCGKEKREIAITLIELVRIEILDEHFEKARDLHLTQGFFDDMHRLIKGKNLGPRS
tara:strand:- start:76 stop:342 length:267 start_codon:yes stop_codon:yes gene_type:complete